MNKTWTSGAIELLDHASGHLKQNSAFDKRIAFISIDNSVEIIVKTFLSLPKQFFGTNRPSRKEIDEAFNSFTSHLELLYKYAGNKLIGIDPGDIEHYHRIRNTLYHDGTGLAVDQQYINAYFIIAKLLLKRLFNVDFEEQTVAPSLENIITNWNKIEEYLSEVLNTPYVEKGTYKWEDAMRKGFLTKELVTDITILRQKRNKLVHSKDIDRSEIKTTFEESVRVLKDLNKQLNNNKELLKDRNYFYEPDKTTLHGKLIKQSFLWPPGYGETPALDMVEDVWILNLEKAINVHVSRVLLEKGNFKGSQFNIDRIQLHTSAHNIDLTEYENKNVSLTGELWEAHTGHHFTPVLMTVENVK